MANSLAKHNSKNKELSGAFGQELESINNHLKAEIATLQKNRMIKEEILKKMNYGTSIKKEDSRSGIGRTK